jgi:hypothetical protein
VRLPKTGNGELDVRALASQITAAYGPAELPSDATPWRLVLAWRQTHNDDRLGPDANFFTSGGHSLLPASLPNGRHASKPSLGLVVVSSEAPDIAARPLGRLPSRQLWDHLVRDGCVSAELAADPRLRRVAKTSICADFNLLESYVHADAALPDHRLSRRGRPGAAWRASRRARRVGRPRGVEQT